MISDLILILSPELVNQMFGDQLQICGKWNQHARSALCVTSGQCGCWRCCQNRCGRKVLFFLELSFLQAMMEWGMNHLASKKVWQHKERGVIWMRCSSSRRGSRLESLKRDINLEIMFHTTFQGPKVRLMVIPFQDGLFCRRSCCRDWCRFSC